MKHALLALALTLSFATAALADDTTTAPAPTPTVQTVHGHRVFVLPNTHIRGERQAPYQFNLSGRSAPEYRGTDGDQHFAQEVVSAVRHTPF